MANVRNTGGPAFRVFVIALINALITDYTSGRSKIVALVADLTAVRTSVVAALRRANTALLRRLPLGAVLADLTELRSKLAAAIIDYAAGRAEVVKLVADVDAMLARLNAGALSSGALADGTTAGCIKTVADVAYRIAGRLYAKAATDDLWNLSAQVDTDATHYRAYWLYLDTSGNPSVAAGADTETSEALAIAALPALDAAKAVVGVYVAGPSTDFNGVAGLDSYGTYYNGWPTTLAKTAAAPAAATASAPAALTTAATAGIANGTTAGRLRTRAEYEFEIAGRVYTKASTDDLWNLSAETDTAADKYRAYWLYLDSAGTASFAAGTDADSEADAIAALPAETSSKCPVGVFVAGLACDFDAVGGLSAQGTIIDGRPAAAADPAAMTATNPSAMTAASATLVTP